MFGIDFHSRLHLILPTSYLSPRSLVYRSLLARRIINMQSNIKSRNLCDLSLSEKSKSIAFYIDNREEMVSQMFASLHRRELYELLPENLKV